jgi:hypothetical protein
MSSSNFPNPDKIPDMSLGDRREAPRVNPEPATSYQPIEQSVPPSPTPAEPKPPAVPEWRAGDRVLAPWEPFYLYPGVIKQILADDARGDQALIDFDDGGEGWVFVYSLCPFEFKAGQDVEMRRRADNQYHPAEIVDVDGEEIQVKYYDGTTEWTTVTSLRTRCIENGPGATATRFAPFQTPAAPPSSGTGIPSWAIWVGAMLLLAVLRVACREMGR